MPTKGKKRPIMRWVMYTLFIIVCILPLPLILCLAPNNGTTLFVAGAAELAFAFYAFTSGNAAYSMAPILWHKVARRRALRKAEGIISAARLISIGAVLLIITGIVAGTWDPHIVQLPVLSVVLLALVFVVRGAMRLARNISFVNNEYLESRRLEDYNGKN